MMLQLINVKVFAVKQCFIILLRVNARKIKDKSFLLLQLASIKDYVLLKLLFGIA